MIDPDVSSRGFVTHVRLRRGDIVLDYFEVLLLWHGDASRGRLVATHSFPGRPVAVADFLGTGSASIPVENPEGALRLIAPARGK